MRYVRITQHRARGIAQIGEQLGGARGDKNRAFEWLDRAYRQGDGALTQVKLDPMLRNLRGDPRYPALLRRA